MQKVFHFIVELSFWFLLVLSKILIILLLLLILNSLIEINNYINLTVSILGLIYGIYYAEKIRKKYGCSAYWSRIYSTPDINNFQKKDDETKK